MKGPDSRSEGGLTDVSPRYRSVECPKGVDLADVVDHREQPPLYIHLPFGPQREAVHALLDTDVGKDWFHDTCTACGASVPSRLA